MSYDISLVDPVTKETLHSDKPHNCRGGTYAVGGTTQLYLNVTWNYAKTLYRILGPNGIRSLYGKTGAESLPMLKEAISKLGDDINADYWKECDGNVKRCLSTLLAFAQLRPDGVWEGD